MLCVDNLCKHYNKGEVTGQSGGHHGAVGNIIHLQRQVARNHVSSISLINQHLTVLTNILKALSFTAKLRHVIIIIINLSAEIRNVMIIIITLSAEISHCNHNN